MEINCSGNGTVLCYDDGPANLTVVPQRKSMTINNGSGNGDDNRPANLTVVHKVESNQQRWIMQRTSLLFHVSSRQLMAVD